MNHITNYLSPKIAELFQPARVYLCYALPGSQSQRPARVGGVVGACQSEYGDDLYPAESGGSGGADGEG